MNEIDVIRKIVKAKKTKLNIFVEDPFGPRYKMNLCYYKLCFFLEEGTNKVVYKDGNGNSVPMTTPTFHTYLNMNRPSVNNVVFKLRKEGVLMKVTVYSKSCYYMNPNYAFNGDNIPYFLLKLFERDDELVYNENKFNIKEIDETDCST